MPINQLERHPYLNYREGLSKENEGQYTGLIIGSFPIYACSNLLDENLKVIQENNFQNQIRFRFFYGSNDSQFWDYIFQAFGTNNAIVQENCISLLERNKLIITDALYQTNRRSQSSSDSDLMISENVNDFVLQNLLLNRSIEDLIIENPNLKNLFFTATGLNGKSPFGWFSKIFGNNLVVQNLFTVEGRTWSFNCVIDNRKFNVFMLPTPKPRGIHFSDNQRTLAFCNYLQSVDADFYNEINNISKILRTPIQTQRLSYHRDNFLVEAYRQAMVENNLYFDGNL